ncbi:MAG: type VI secretion system baseplate subunit TssE [Sphingomonadaceae bacterium]
MTGFTPGLFDRLLGEQVTGLTLEQLKDAVARDLEDLLNTRAALPETLLQAYPECSRSIINYGLLDIAGMCLSSSADRARICASLKAAIARPEPRLSNVQARLERGAGAINRVSFVINATLALPTLNEGVSFDAVLQPSTLHYSINRSARGATP